MTTHVLELKKSEAINTIAASDYVVNLPTILNVEDGTRFDLQMAAIDSQVADTQTIVITDPVELAMDFSYYEYDLPAFDPSDNYTKFDVSGDVSHNETYKFSAAYTEPVVYQYNSIVYNCTSFISKRRGYLTDGYNIKNDADGRIQGVTGNFNFFEPFTGNRVWSPFAAAAIDARRTVDCKFTSEQTLVYDATKENDATNIKPNTGQLSAVGPNILADGTFYRSIKVTVTIRFFDVNGTGITCTASKTTDVDSTSGNLVTFLPGDFTLPDGEAWDGIHIGTQFYSFYKAEYTEFINNIGVYETGDATKQTKVQSQDVNQIVSTGAGRQLIIDNTSITIPVGRYEPKSLAKIISRGFDTTKVLTDLSGLDLRYPSNPLLSRIDVMKGDRVVFKQMVDLDPVDPSTGMVDFSTNCYYYDDADSNRTVGAAVYAMEYGITGENSYEITYMHTPLYNPDEQDTQNIAYFQSPSGEVFTIPTATGVVVHKLSPPDFWNDTLGFNQDNLIVPLKTDVCGVYYYDGDEAIQKTPRGAITLDTFTKPLYTRRVDPSINPNPSFFEIQDTESVLGELPAPATAGGYFKLEIIGMGLENNYMSRSGINKNIFGVISTQYDSQNFITGFGDQGISYTHRGFPFNLSSIRVRILDPDGNTIPSLGDKTTVFIKVTIPEDADEDPDQSDQ